MLVTCFGCFCSYVFNSIGTQPFAVFVYLEVAALQQFANHYKFVCLKSELCSPSQNAFSKSELRSRSSCMFEVRAWRCRVYAKIHAPPRSLTPSPPRLYPALRDVCNQRRHAVDFMLCFLVWISWAFCPPGNNDQNGEPCKGWCVL